MSDRIEALLEERRGYLTSGKKDRAAQVDAVLADLGVGVKKVAPVGDADIEAPESHSTPAVETAVKRGPSRPRKS